MYPLYRTTSKGGYISVFRVVLLSLFISYNKFISIQLNVTAGCVFVAQGFYIAVASEYPIGVFAEFSQLLL